MEAGKSKILRVGWQAGKPEDLRLEFQFEDQQAGEFFLAASLHVLFRPSTDGMRLTHIMEGNLLYSKSTDLNVNLIRKHPYRNNQNNV